MPDPRSVADGVHYVYRCYSGDELLYIGCTKNVETRMEAHRRSKQARKWYSLMTSMTYAEYPTREEATRREAEAIRQEDPRFNVTHRGPAPPRNTMTDLPVKLFDGVERPVLFTAEEVCHALKCTLGDLARHRLSGLLGCVKSNDALWYTGEHVSALLRLLVEQDARKVC